MDNANTLIEELEPKIDKVDFKTQQEFVELAMKSIQQNDIIMHLDKGKLDLGKAKVISNKETSRKTVVIPYKIDSSIKGGSSLTVTFYKNKELKGYQELIIEQKSSDKYTYKY